MPDFTVILGAYRYESNRMHVEAPDITAACHKALVEDDGMYEACDLGESWVEAVEDENGIPYDELPEIYREPEKYELGPVERLMIVAALRLMQREIEFGVVGPDIEAIATNNGAHPALSTEEINFICERLNR